MSSEEERQGREEFQQDFIECILKPKFPWIAELVKEKGLTITGFNIEKGCEEYKISYILGSKLVNVIIKVEK